MFNPLPGMCNCLQRLSARMSDRWRSNTCLTANGNCATVHALVEPEVAENRVPSLVEAKITLVTYVCCELDAAVLAAKSRRLGCALELDCLRLFGPALLLCDQASDESGPFSLVGLDALAQKHFADLRYGPLFLIRNLLNVPPELGVNSEY